MRAGNVFNRYYGPFEIHGSTANGIRFGKMLGSGRIRLRNLSPNSLTVTATHIASEAAPGGQNTIVAAPPLLVRGALNTTDLTYPYSTLVLGQTHSWTLPAAGQPGAEVELVFGLNRAAITANAGDLLAGIIRFTDSLGHSMVDMPVSATAGSDAGLWVGTASVTKVRSFLKTYQRDATGAPVTSNQTNSFGSYITTGVNTNLGNVPRAFPLRLILHTDGANSQLLQRVYHGQDIFSSLINASRQDFLDQTKLASARRISAAHLPFSELNTGWAFSGPIKPGSTVSVTVTLAHDDQASNPFLHTFHPDHDNLDARFSGTQLASGFESYNVKRLITLAVNPPADDFNAITRSGQSYSGVYSETLTFEGQQTPQGVEASSYESQGTFTLNRINNIATLTTQ